MSREESGHTILFPLLLNGPYRGRKSCMGIWKFQRENVLECTVEHLPVDGIDAGCQDLDEHLTSLRHGRGDVPERGCRVVPAVTCGGVRCGGRECQESTVSSSAIGGLCPSTPNVKRLGVHLEGERILIVDDEAREEFNRDAINAERTGRARKYASDLELYFELTY